MCVTLTFDLDLDLVQGQVKAKSRKIRTFLDEKFFGGENLPIFEIPPGEKGLRKICNPHKSG